MKININKYYFKNKGDEWQGPFYIWQLSKFIFGKTEGFEFWHRSICPISPQHKLPGEAPESCTERLSIENLKKRLSIFWMFFGLVIPITISFSIFKNTFNTSIIINVTNNWEHFTLTGEYNDKLAKFEIAFLSNEFCWDFASDSSIDNGKNAVNVINSQINAFPPFGKALGLIAVGTASHEHTSVHDEYNRSVKRAKTEMKALKFNKITNSKNLYEFYLGLHKENLGDDINATDYQRRVIIIGIMEQEHNMTSEEISLALINAIKDKRKKHPLLLNNYTNKDWFTIVHNPFKD